MADMEITRNERVMGTDGQEMGRVVHVIVDTHTKQLTDLVVEHDHQEMVVPISAVERTSSGAITLRNTSQGMAFQREMYHEVDEDRLDATTATPSAPGVTVRDADEDSVTISDTRGAAKTRTTETTTRAAAVPTPPVPTKQTNRTETARTTETARDGETIKVPVIEEQLRAGVREREAGVFRLSKTVTQEQQSIDVPVQREEVYITERAVNRPATQADMDMMDRDISVPTREQEVVTSKQAVVTGEVEIRKDTVTETERVTDTVRREEVHVDDLRNPRIHAEGITGGTGAMANFSTEQRTRYAAMDKAGQERYMRFSDTERTDYDRKNPLEKAADAVKGAAKDVKNAVDGNPRT